MTVKSEMRKMFLLMLICAMLAPIGAHAQEAQSSEVISWDADGTIVSGPYHHSIDWKTVGYKPKEVTVQKQARSLVVCADVTTASRCVVVQYSRDPEFKRGVKTRTFSNARYKAPVLAFIASDGARYKNDWHYTDSIVIKQDDRILSSRRKRVGEWSRLSITQNDVDASREKIRYVKRMYIPNVAAPSGIYVRVRNVYDGNIYQTVYSSWSRTVKVR